LQGARTRVHNAGGSVYWLFLCVWHTYYNISARARHNTTHTRTTHTHTHKSPQATPAHMRHCGERECTHAYYARTHSSSSSQGAGLARTETDLCVCVWWYMCVCCCRRAPLLYYNGAQPQHTPTHTHTQHMRARTTPCADQPTYIPNTTVTTPPSVHIPICHHHHHHSHTRTLTCVLMYMTH
jgi:hypothetical protein